MHFKIQNTQIQVLDDLHSKLGRLRLYVRYTPAPIPPPPPPLGVPAAADITDLPADTKAGKIIIKWNTPKDNGALITQ